MKPELVGKVRRDLQSAWTDGEDAGYGWWDFMARYALALADRAAREGLAAGARMGLYDLVTTPAECVERAVEGA